MSCDLKVGTFRVVKGQGFVDFMTTMGHPAEMASKIKGTNWQVECCHVPGNKWQVIAGCKETGKQSCEVYEWDKEAAVISPMLGGPVKTIFTCPEPNIISQTIKSAKFGNVSFTKVFTEQGVTITVKHENSGASYTEQWARWVNEEGSYRYVCNEGGEAYMKATHEGPLTQSFEKMSHGAHLSLKHLGNDAWQFSDTFGGQCYTLTFKMDEECDYNFPGIMERKMICTRIAPGKVKCIMRAKNGNVEEWVRWVDSEGNMKWSGLDKKTGLKCMIKYEKYCLIEGTWKPISLMGTEKMAHAFGMPAQKASAMAKDCDYTITIKEKGDTIIVNSDNKYTPFNLVYKLNEEFEFPVPGVKEPFKCIETVVGNTYSMVQKNSKMTVMMSTKITNSFMITETRILGTDVCCKAIYTRS